MHYYFIYERSCKSKWSDFIYWMSIIYKLCTLKEFLEKQPFEDSWSWQRIINPKLLVIFKIRYRQFSNQGTKLLISHFYINNNIFVLSKSQLIFFFLFYEKFMILFQNSSWKRILKLLDSFVFDILFEK